MTDPMHPVREADRSGCSCHLEGSKPGGVVNNIVRDQNFFPPARQEIFRGSIVKTAEDSDTGEEQYIRPSQKAWVGGGWGTG